MISIGLFYSIYNIYILLLYDIYIERGFITSGFLLVWHDITI